MGSISTGVGLISGIDSASIIDQLMLIEARPMVRLQTRIGTIQGQRTALLDVNARLLNFKTISSAFRKDDIFQSTLASSSDEEVLAAKASADAQPGSYKFIVRQLVKTSQQLSRGFASRDETPLGMSQISFEFGKGRLSRDPLLEELNGGTGVDRGRITISDGTDEAEIDLTDVTSLSEVVKRINDASDIDVTATVKADHIEIVDNGGGDLTITSDDGDTTAEDLGIAVVSGGATVTGTSVNTLGAQTALKALNDGNGVLIQQGVADFTITKHDGTTVDIDLGRIDNPITGTTLLEDLNNGAGVTIDSDTDAPELKVTDRSGTVHEIDLTGITTVGGLIARVSSGTGGVVTLSINSGADGFDLDDSSGGTGLFKVEGTDESGTDTAEDLGLLEEDGVSADTINGEEIPSTIDKPEATTLQDVIDRISDADPDLTAAIAGDGLRLTITDASVGGSNLTVSASSSNPDAASDLGIETSVAGNITGSRILSALDTVLASTLNGGQGLGAATQISITDRSGAAYGSALTISGYDTLGEIIDAINSNSVAELVDVEVAINEAGNGLIVTDSSGATVSNLVVSGDGATALGIAVDDAVTTKTGDNLQRQYVSNGTRLEDLNYGRGVRKGSFEITDGLGARATVNIATEKTVYDVLRDINSRGLAVKARVNDNGDGIIIEEDAAALGGATPTTKIKVTNLSGGTATDLNLVGEASGISEALDGSYERVVDLAASDGLDEVVSKINAAGVPVSAAVLNTGSGAAPFRLSLTSKITGAAGDLVVDTGGVDLGLSVLSRGEDAKVFFGSDDPAEGFLVTSDDNTLDDVLPGVTIDLLKASDDVVTVTTSRDTAKIIDTVRSFTTAFNDVIGRLDEYDFFDSESEQRGPLFGDPTVAQVRTGLYRIGLGSALNVSGDLSYLSQVGITLSSEGLMSFDEQEFREKYEDDPDSVEKLFAEYDVTALTSEEVATGVTISKSSTEYNALGIAEIFRNLLDDLTDSVDGVLKQADNAFDAQIGQLEDRIETIEERIGSKRERLQSQFIEMERALAELQNSSAALNSLVAQIGSFRN